MPGARSLRDRLVGSLDDLDELLGNEGRAADQAAVDVRLSQQVIGILLVHGAAVENGDRAGDLRAVQLADDRTDVLADLFGLFRRRGLAGADGPNRLISHYKRPQLCSCKSVNCRQQLSAAQQNSINWQTRYRNLQNKVQPYLDAMRHAPERVRNFFENLLAQKPERTADAPSKASPQKNAEL